MKDGILSLELYNMGYCGWDIVDRARGMSAWQHCVGTECNG